MPCDLGLIYDDDAYVELEARRAPSADGRPAGLMGRQVAGRSFLAALLRHGSWNDLAIVARHPGAERSLERACRENPSERARRLHLADERRLLDAPSVPPPARLLHLPAPLDSRYAWARQTLGPSAFSLSGVTHTLCSVDAVKQLCDLVTAPFEPHDALICTSSAVERMVRTVTDDYASYLRDRHGGSPGRKPRLATIPLGVDVDRFRPASPEERMSWRSRLGVADDEVAALFVGRLSHHAKAHPFPMFRGVELAAEATGRRVHLLVSGWAPKTQILDAFIEGARSFAPGVKVTFLDGMDPEARFGVWRAADLAISLSDNLQETFGLVVAEAMACGLPVIASDWDGYRDLVEPDVTGLLVPTTMISGATHGSTARLLFGAIDYDQFLAETSQAVAVDVPSTGRAIARLVSDDNHRRALGNAARRRAVERFAWPSVIARYEDLWAEQDAMRRGRDHAGPDPLAPALYPAPERSFSGYPSRWVGLQDTELSAAGHAAEDLPRLLAMPLTHHVAESRVSDLSLLRQALAEATPRCPISALDALFLAAGVDARRARATVGWLMKYDLLRIATDRAPEALARSGEPSGPFEP